MKILIVEDDVAIQNFLKEGFRYKQCVIDQAYNGIQGFEKLTHKKYDIAIVDLLLPLLEGTALIEQIRESGIKTPIIVLSVLQDLSTQTYLLNIGVEDYMTKPFSFDD